MFQEYYQQYQSEFIRTIQELDFEVIQQIADKMEEARQQDRQVFIIGNGGSAASATHWACDFGKGVNIPGLKRFRVSSLTDNLAWITALGNDIQYADIFKEQLQNWLQPGDLLIGLSVSGDSSNVVNAFQYAQEKQATVIALIGEKEGRMKALADLCLVIPSADYGIVEDVHMYVNHVISQHLKQRYLQEKETEK